MAEPALRLMTWIENNKDPALAERYIADLLRLPLAEIVALPYVAAQGDDWSDGSVHRSRLRVRTLVTLRWIMIAGEVAVLIAVVMFIGLVVGRGSRFYGKQDWYGLCGASRKILSEDLLFLKRRLEYHALSIWFRRLC